MATSTSRADDDDGHPVRRSNNSARFLNALIGALVTFFLSLLALAYNAGIASANIGTLESNQGNLFKEVADLRTNQSTSNAEITARLSAIQQMQQDMSNTQAQTQAQLQALMQEKNGHGNP